MSTSVPPLKTSCHCNAIVVTTTHPPEFLNECQCSLCRRHGAQWAYYYHDKDGHGIKVNSIEVTDYRVREDGKMEAGGEDRTSSATSVLPTKTYSWGDDEEWFVFCEKCGCLMFWYPQKSVAEGGNRKMGINARMVNDPMSLRFVEKRITWAYAMATKKGVYDENGPIRQ
ncbi:hypothetical protein CBER1_09490 [Cercospora berteroae]|uniref:CENP-V/GFA domain-containing protein n=1 Tax=Cercospora berteroae TaxID=357750 RepID=A0A2S6CAK9_9PEZI|nr:hypothetical protein CBER1_09490 [Cercospora berteroae]